jgi:hypothetical protein
MADGNNNPNDPFGDFLQWFFSQDLGEKPVVARKMGSAEYFEI